MLNEKIGKTCFYELQYIISDQGSPVQKSKKKEEGKDRREEKERLKTKIMVLTTRA